MLLGNLNLNKLAERLKKIDHFLVDILKIRLASGGLSDYVAENKRKTTPDGIFNKRRQEIEDRRIDNMKKWATENGIDPNFAASLMYQIISESCREQDKVMIEKFKKGEKQLNELDGKEVCEFKKQNLLSLTAEVAKYYNQSYTKESFGSELINQFEKKVLNSLLANIDGDKDLALDFGCATGIISLNLSEHFNKIVGYDISPEMTDVANQQKQILKIDNVDFVVADLENDKNISIADNSVSLIVANMGTISDFKNTEKILLLIKKLLKHGGKFFLSFYNSESLLNSIGFAPWPLPLSAYIDQEKNCLEVHYKDKVYFLHAQPRTVDEVKALLSDFNLENLYTYPTLGSILPDIITKVDNNPDDKIREIIKQIDNTIANSSQTPYGTYIVAVGSK